MFNFKTFRINCCSIKRASKNVGQIFNEAFSKTRPDTKVAFFDTNKIIKFGNENLFIYRSKLHRRKIFVQQINWAYLENRFTKYTLKIVLSFFSFKSTYFYDPIFSPCKIVSGLWITFKIRNSFSFVPYKCISNGKPYYQIQVKA